MIYRLLLIIMLLLPAVNASAEGEQADAQTQQQDFGQWLESTGDKTQKGIKNLGHTAHDKLKTSSTWVAQNAGCPTCGVLGALIDASLNFTEFFAGAISGSTQLLAGTFLALYALLQAAKSLFPFAPLERTTQLLNATFGRMGLGLLVILVLQAPVLMQNYILYPMIDTTTQFSQTILESASTLDNITTPKVCGVEGGTPRDRMKNSIMCQAQHAQASIWEAMMMAMSIMWKDGWNNNMDTYYKTAEQLEALQADANAKADQNIVQVAAGNVAGAVKDGFSSVGSAFETVKNITFSGMGHFANIVFRIIAWFVVVLIFTILWAKYPVMLIDAVLKWAVIFALSPLMLAAFIFPGLRSATFAALKTLFHAGLTIIFLAVILGIGIGVLDQILVQLKENKELLQDGGSVQSAEYWLVIASGIIMMQGQNMAFQLAGRFARSGLQVDAAKGIWSALLKIFWVAVDIVTFGQGTAVKTGLQAVKQVAK